MASTRIGDMVSACVSIPYEQITPTEGLFGKVVPNPGFFGQTHYLFKKCCGERMKRYLEGGSVKTAFCESCGNYEYVTDISYDY